MSHTFTLNIPKGMDINSGIEKVRAGIEAMGGVYQYDVKTARGSFSVKGVSGSFILTGEAVIITITKKPFIVSHAYVEKSIRDAFAAA